MFQKNVTDFYLSQLDNAVLSERYERYSKIFLDKSKQENIRSSKEEQYQEGFLRDLFVSVLGYTIKPENNFNLFTEAKNDVKNKSNSKKADGAICEENNENNVKAVIELKGTSTKDLDLVAFQAFSYKNFHNDCKYIIVSNFEKLRFYVEVQSDFEEFDLFKLSFDRFCVLYVLLEVNQIKNDVALKIKNESLSEEKEITNNFYADYSTFKRCLFEDLTENNRETDKLLLFKKTQKLLDRILFVLFCEDRNLLPANSIMGIISDYKKLKELGYYQPLYNVFKTFFNRIDKGFKHESDNSKDVFAYNGGLFKTDEILDNVKIGDDVLYIHAQKLANYDFQSQISVDILGRIFENSLTEIEEVQKEIENEKNGIKTENNNLGKRKKDGVFYTPEYITKYIVENTIGKLCHEKKDELKINDIEFSIDKKYQRKTIEELDERLNKYREWLLSLKILDCACGSGAFLNSALRELRKEHTLIDYFWSKIHKDELNFSQIDNTILENNLYGVDINEDSIEITKLSLWLHTASKNRKLTTLNNKIKCGNSLIADESVAGEKAFVWEKEFPEVFENDGFDVIIGNPPYVSAPTQIASAELAKNRQAIIDSGKYKTLFQKWDLYIPFIELGVRHLLKDGGLCSMIVPYPLTNQLYAEKCRRMLLDEYSLKEIVDCSETKIFADAVVQSCIFIARKARDDEKVKVCTIDGTKVNPLVEKTREELLQDEKTFVWNTKNEERRANRHEGMHVLGDFCYVSYGLRPNSDEKTARGEFKKEDLISEIEDGTPRRKYIEAKDIERYKINRIRYLEYGTARSPAKLTRPTFNELYEPIKLMFNVLGELTGTIDTKKLVHNHSLIACVLWKDLHGVENKSIDGSIKKFSTMKREDMETLSETVDLRYLLAVMNSTYARVLLANIRGGDYHIYPEHIRNIPIPALPHEAQQPLIALADKMLSLTADLQKKATRFISRIKETYSPQKITQNLEAFYNLSFADFAKELAKQKVKLSLKQKDELEDYFSDYVKEISALREQIAATDREINAAVYALYGLTEEEIAVVEKS